MAMVIIMMILMRIMVVTINTCMYVFMYVCMYVCMYVQSLAIPMATGRRDNASARRYHGGEPQGR